MATEFFNDMSTGQADKAAALAVPDPQFATLLPTMADAMGAMNSFRNSVKAKFADAGAAYIAKFPDMTPNLANAQMVITDNKAKISTPTVPDLVDLTKTDAGWRVDKPSDSDLQAMQFIKQFADAVKAVVPDIDAGKYATIDDLNKDLAGRLQAANIPFPGMMPGTTTQPTTTPTGGATTPSTEPAPAGGGTTPTPAPATAPAQ